MDASKFHVHPVNLVHAGYPYRVVIPFNLTPEPV